jgi:hypothetical protein
MKISRKNLNRLIESLLSEDRLPPAYVQDDEALFGIRRQKDQLGDFEMDYATKLDATEAEISNAEQKLMQQAMISYIKNPNRPIGSTLDKLFMSGTAGMGALFLLMAPEATIAGTGLQALGAEAIMASAPVIFAAMSGGLLGSFVDEVFKVDLSTFENELIRRAANAAGLGEEIGRYSQPGVDAIKKTGFTGLKPKDVDPEFQRKLAIMHILSNNIKKDMDKPKLITSYENFVSQGIIDGDAFGAYADEVSEDLFSQMKQAASSR